MKGQKIVHADVFQSFALFAVDEIQILGHIDFRDIDCRCRVPNADQPVRILVRERFEQHTFHNAEDHGIGANADSYGNQNDDREKRCAAKPPENLLELANE